MSGKRRATPAYWFDGAPVPPSARALAALYAGLVGLRRAVYRHRLRRGVVVSIPVVVVGNLIAGGSGKTPLTIAIVKRLLAEGLRPGVATRGYGRLHPDAALWVEAQTAPEQGGDEPVLIARRTGVKVRADRDRVAAARALQAAACNVVVCDDGLQHYRLARDIEIEVIDGRRRYGNGLLLPAGPLREPVERGLVCDFRVLNLAEETSNGDLAVDSVGEWGMRLQPGHAVALLGMRQRRLESFRGRRVHAVAGTGDPERFFDMLRRRGIAVVPHAFADHHRYGEEDFRFGSDLPVLMTEKDAVKCLPFANEQFFSVPVDARLPEAFWAALLDRLRSVRGGRRGNS